MVFWWFFERDGSPKNSMVNFGNFWEGTLAVVAEPQLPFGGPGRFVEVAT